jgi:hypothetical protein
MYIEKGKPKKMHISLSLGYLLFYRERELQKYPGGWIFSHTVEGRH